MIIIYLQEDTSINVARQRSVPDFLSIGSGSVNLPGQMDGVVGGHGCALAVGHHDEDYQGVEDDHPHKT